MDFRKARAEAERWTQSGRTSFRLIESDDKERRLTFLCDSVSFYLLLPCTGEKRVNVWSDNEHVVQEMQDIQDYAESCSEKSITDILDYINAKLAKVTADFGHAKSEAERWTQSGRTSFQLIESDDKERRLTFLCDGVSFFIVLPPVGEKGLNVWSDNDAVIQEMQKIQDYAESCKEKSMTHLLEYINSQLVKLLRPAAEPNPPQAVAGAGAAVVAPDEDESSDDAGFEDDPEEDVGEEDLDEGLADDYYEDGDPDVADEGAAPDREGEHGEEASFFAGRADSMAVTRIMKDYKDMQTSHGKFGFSGSPRQNDLFIWDISLKDFPPESMLARDLQKYAKKYNREPTVELEVTFPPTYPMEPPFVRVIRPRFKFLTGHVTIGGSICMEMLTKSGWRPANDLEGILVTIRSEIMSDPNTQLDSNPDRAYDLAEAKHAFQRMVARYGWDR